MGLTEQLVGLNDYLTAVYRTETRISTLLAGLGFDGEQIESLRDQYAKPVVTSLVAKVRERLSAGRDGDRQCMIISRRFGLDGEPTDTLQTLGNKLGISRERVRQIEKKALRRSRHPSSIRFLESGLYAIASSFTRSREPVPATHSSL